MFYLLDAFIIFFLSSAYIGHDCATSLSLFTFMPWRRKWQPTPVFLPGESQGRGAWWAAVYGVAQSRTRLKRLSSSSSSAYVILDFIEILESLAMSCISFGKLSDNISSIIA